MSYIAFHTMHSLWEMPVALCRRPLHLCRFMPVKAMLRCDMIYLYINNQLLTPSNGHKRSPLQKMKEQHTVWAQTEINPSHASLCLATVASSETCRLPLSPGGTGSPTVSRASPLPSTWTVRRCTQLNYFEEMTLLSAQTESLSSAADSWMRLCLRWGPLRS